MYGSELMVSLNVYVRVSVLYSYFAVHLKDGFELVAQSMLGRLILLLPNSAKVRHS